MSGFVSAVSVQSVPTTQVNFSQGIQAVSIENLDANANSVLYSTTGTDIKGDNAILKFEEDIKKLTVSGSMSYVSNYPIAVEVGFNENTFCTGLLAQNKDATDGSSVSILLSNDLGTDSNYYAGMTMLSSNSVPVAEYPQFGAIPNALSINSQSSNVVLSAWNGGQSGGGTAPENAKKNDNIMLGYNTGLQAHIINHFGQLIVGANNPSYVGSTYGGDDGGTDKVLTSNGTNGLKWSVPEPAGISGLWFNVGYETSNVNISGAPTLVKESQALSLISGNRYYIQYNAVYQPSSANHQYVFTLARSTVSGATGGASLNLASGTNISAGITALGFQTSANYNGGGATHPCSSTASIVDLVASASGTYYYTLWAQTDDTSATRPINVSFIVLKA